MSDVHLLPTAYVSWTCTTCGADVTDDQDGYLSISMATVRQHQDDLAAFDAAQDQGSIALGDLIAAYPNPARWRCYHAEHDPEPDGFAYEVELDKVRTFAGLARTTAFLAGKNWTRFTDWNEIVERKAP